MRTYLEEMASIKERQAKKRAYIAGSAVLAVIGAAIGLILAYMTH